ncbi:hypothetical protein Trydic_g17157 [Trypoxylus dichotomus]
MNTRSEARVVLSNLQDLGLLNKSYCHPDGDYSDSTNIETQETCHMKATDNIGVRPFKCEKCEKEYRHKANLNRHKRYECDGEYFPCPDCGKRYKVKGSLTRHIKFECKREVMKREKMFGCPNCKNRYSYKAGLKQHLTYECVIPRSQELPSDHQLESEITEISEKYPIKIHSGLKSVVKSTREGELMKNFQEVWENSDEIHKIENAEKSCPKEYLLFKGQRSVEKSYVFLTAGTSTELIPKLGDRIGFIKKHQQHYLAPSLNVSNSTTAGRSSTLTVSNSDTSLDDVKLLLVANKAEAIEEENTVEKYSLLDGTQETPYKNQIQNVDSTCQRFRFSTNQSEFPNGLENYLNSIPDGKLLLEKRHNINEYCRKKLCKLVLDGLILKYDKKIPKHAFMSASNEIEEVFPGESRHIYFVPYRPRTNTTPRTLSSGKLWAKFINYKRSLSKYTLDAPAVEEQNECETEQIEDVTSHILFLKHRLEPYGDILFSGNKTFIKRQSIIKELEIHDFFKEFPVIKQPFGYKLFLQDFCALYPSRENNFLEIWPKLSKNILSLIEQRKILSFDGQSNLADSAKHILALKCLCFLFPPITVRTKRHQKNWRPSKIEVQQSFFLHVQDYGGLKKAVSRRKSILKQNGETMQPLVVVQGDNNNFQSYVMIDDIVYTLESPLKAVDTCFKTFFALNLKYPAESAHIWTFIQQKIYNIYTSLDKHLSAVATVTTDLNMQT